MSSIVEITKINSNNESTRLRLLDMTANPIEKMAYVARISHRSHETSKRTDIELLKDIIRWGHLSVFEHAYASIEISGVSRACTHQLVRHRHFSVMQESQRYVKPNGTVPVTPETILDNEKSLGIYDKFMEQSFNTYNQLLSLGIPKEDARMVLTNATPTKLVLTGNFRTWREFIHKRDIKAAQEEIRALACEIREILSAATAPFLWKYEI